MTPLLSIKQVAAILGVERHKVGSLIASGDLVAVNVGTNTPRGARWRIKPSEVDRFQRHRFSA